MVGGIKEGKRRRQTEGKTEGGIKKKKRSQGVDETLGVRQEGRQRGTKEQVRKGMCRTR